jgi:hypothetical protein
MKYTVWFEGDKGMEWWGDYTSMAEAMRIASWLMRHDDRVNKVSIDIKRKG